MGDNVTLRCHVPRPAAQVEFYQDEHLRLHKRKEEGSDASDFSFIITEMKHAVKYRCRYRALEPPGASEISDPVELVVTDLWFPPPSISLSPKGWDRNGTNDTVRVEMGTDVTIRCWNQYNGSTFLHKDGRSAPIQRQNPDIGGTATFTLFGVTPADAGTYRCSYHPGGYYLLSSPLGNNVTLEVTPSPAAPGAEGLRVNVVVAVVRGCAAALIFGLGLFFLVDARSLWAHRDDGTGGDSFKPIP
ncbi:putative killer cell immunoglobulin-like receptor-like protein KIR3DX1 [Cyrtonyx montezumae]|uniref:putative killer cell immunoglobulin-like receptor-like protein KIR3DX1 n=1 Tax=Cyrtonyx montezumae TaxID=9017 RepID=UPI0032DA4DBF